MSRAWGLVFHKNELVESRGLELLYNRMSGPPWSPKKAGNKTFLNNFKALLKIKNRCTLLVLQYRYEAQNYIINLSFVSNISCTVYICFMYHWICSSICRICLIIPLICSMCLTYVFQYLSNQFHAYLPACTYLPCLFSVQ